MIYGDFKNVVYTSLLEDLPPHDLFGDHVPDTDFGELFVYLFYHRYGHRQLGCWEVSVFRRWVLETYYAKRSKYLKLWASVDLVDNPISTTRVHTTYKDSEKRKSKLYGDYQKHGWESDETNTHKSTSTQEGGGREASSHDGERVRSVEKGKETHNQKDGETSRTWFSDTPQNLAGGEGGAGSDNSLEGGYLTTFTKVGTNKYGEGGSGSVSQGDVGRHRLGGESEATSSSKYVNDQGTDYGTRDNTTKTNTVQTTGSTKVTNHGTLRAGYEHVNPSKLLQDYRETFINVVDEFVNEFETCFLQIA